MSLKLLGIILGVILIVGLVAGFLMSAFSVNPKITTTTSGLKIEDIVLGKGKEVKTGDTVTVHYKGTLENDKQFDSSYDRGQPFTVQIGMGQVIKGWEEGIPGMRVSGKRRLVIPSELGYGTQGAGGIIPPNATLIFEIELLNIK